MLFGPKYSSGWFFNGAQDHLLYEDPTQLQNRWRRFGEAERKIRRIRFCTRWQWHKGNMLKAVTEFLASRTQATPEQELLNQKRLAIYGKVVTKKYKIALKLANRCRLELVLLIHGQLILLRFCTNTVFSNPENEIQQNSRPSLSSCPYYCIYQTESAFSFILT